MCFWKHVILFLIWLIPFLDLLYLSLNIIVCILGLNCFWYQIHVLWKKKWYLVKKNSSENIPRLEFEVDLKKYILIYIPLILFCWILILEYRINICIWEHNKYCLNQFIKFKTFLFYSPAQKGSNRFFKTENDRTKQPLGRKYQ